MKYFCQLFLYSSLIVWQLLISCAEVTEKSLYDPNYTVTTKPNPVITGIEPATGTFSGISMITISGQNFSANQEENHVYFNGLKGTVLEATNSMLSVKVPVVVSDSVLIKVRVDGAFLFADFFPYRLSKAVVDFKAIDKFSNSYGLACDQAEQVYLLRADQKDIIRIAHPDSPLTVFANAGVPAQCSGMKFAADGYLYHLRKNKNIYRIPPAGGEREIFTKVNENVTDLDFSASGALFAGGKGEEIYYININDGSSKVVAAYTDYEINALRVYAGYLYVAAKYIGDGIPLGWSEGIWKHLILSDTTLGLAEEVLNWADNASAAGASILTMTFDEDGILYLGLDKNVAIMTVDLSTDEMEPFYPEILSPPIAYMVWGMGQYFYLNYRSDIAEERKILRVETIKKGAPYYGRD